MKIDKETVVGEVVAQNYKAADIFKRYKIDFCCNGNRALQQVSEEKGIALDKLIDELNMSFEMEQDNNDYNNWDLGFLTDYIFNTHHRYVEAKIPEIKQYLNKICAVHGAEHPELYEIRDLFFASADDLTQHLKKEELILFPYIKKIAEAQKIENPLEPSHFGTVENPISMMHHEHDIEGERFRKIAELTNDYTPPEDACNSYRVTFALLKEFENDLHKHIHLENNILFKKAIELEKELKE